MAWSCTVSRPRLYLSLVAVYNSNEKFASCSTYQFEPENYFLILVRLIFILYKIIQISTKNWRFGGKILYFNIKFHVVIDFIIIFIKQFISYSLKLISNNLKQFKSNLFEACSCRRCIIVNNWIFALFSLIRLSLQNLRKSRSEVMQLKFFTYHRIVGVAPVVLFTRVCQTTAVGGRQ